MEIIENQGNFPGVPEGAILGRWQLGQDYSKDCWRLITLGDIGIAGKIALHAEHSKDCAGIFGDIVPAIKMADCSMANLETPFIDSWSTETKGFVGSTRFVPALTEVGFDVLHLASSHMCDFGAQGFAQTIAAVRENDITIIGAGDNESQARQLVIQSIADVKVGWLAAGHTKCRQSESPRLWEFNAADEMINSIQQAKDQVDVLIVSLHWGPMLVDYPYIEQYEAAHKFVDNGASAVIMHHAHILQGVEIYNGAPICYGLGNTLFDPTEGKQQRAKNFSYYKYQEYLTSCVFNFIWEKDKFVGLLAAPFCLPEPEHIYSEEFRIHWPDKKTSKQILERLCRISDDLKGDFSKKLNIQLNVVWKRELSINLCLIFRYGEVWRIWYLLRSVRPRHIIPFFTMCFARFFKVKHNG